MKIALCAAILILCTPSVTSPQARDGVTPPRGGSGVIAGVVLVDEPGTPPARRARVTLNTLDRREPGMTATTDDAGAFTFAGIPSGSYLIQASKTGYLTTNLGAKRSERPGTAVVLKDGERLTGLTMRLTRGGVITGTIFDQNGRPLPDVAVTVLKYSWSALGERTLGQFNRGGSGVTDDRGMYRAWGLPPGEYVVRATMSVDRPARRAERCRRFPSHHCGGDAHGPVVNRAGKWLRQSRRQRRTHDAVCAAGNVRSCLLP